MNHNEALWEEHDAKVRPYIRSHRMFRFLQFVLSVAFVAYLIFSGRGAQLEWILRPFLANGFALWATYFGVLGILWWVLSFPFDLGHYVIERKYHLSKQTLFSWLWDYVKGLLIGLLLGYGALFIVFSCTTYLGEGWWVACASLFILFSVLMAGLFPILFIPLFFKLEPLEPGPLKDRLFSLCARFEVAVNEIYHLGLGEKTEKGNAAFVGIGKTKRIIIGDTLYKKYSMDEVEAVFAHELGHQVHSDLWKGIGFSALLLTVTFFLANLIFMEFVKPTFVVEPVEPWGIFLFGIVVTLVQIPMGPLGAWFSRGCEKKADEFASKTTGQGQPLSVALEKLTIQNWGLFRPNRLIEFLFYSHPAPGRRIERLRASL